MKKIIALFLILALSLSVFVGCNKDKESEDNSKATNGSSNSQNGDTTAKSDLKSALSYLESMYQTGKKSEPMAISMDKDLVSTVVVGGVSYSVSWSVSITEGPSDSVSIGESSKGGHVLLDVIEASATEILFTATATVKDSAGKSDAISFSYKISASAFAGKTDAEIVEMAYALEAGASMESAATLTAKIVQLKAPYDADYGNITIVVAVEGLEDKPIECYRLKGDKVSNDLCVGDTVTVTGILKNYNGTIEFDAGCILDSVASCGVIKPTDSKQIVDLAFALPGGESLPYFTTLTGVVKSIDSAYSDQYKNVTLTIEVEGTSGKKDLVCYRLKGVGADVVAAGDTITVTGVIKNYVKDDNSTIEFDAGCILDSRVPGEGGTEQPGPGTDVPVEKPTTVEGILAAAKALKDGEELPYTVTLTGKVTSVDEAYSEEFGNIIVTANFNGTSMKCYRMKVSADKIPQVGDTITVDGTIKNYYGKLQFVNSTCTKLVAGEKAPSSETAIVDAAYALEAGASLDYQATLTGKVTSIKTAYDNTYKNITVIIAIPGREDKPIECYRMKGDGVDKITVGDTITVTGILKNYNGTIEFDANCNMTKRISGGVVIPTDPKEIVDAAFALEPGKALPYTCTLTGKIKSIDTEYSDQYKNITVTIEVEGTDGKKDLVCYRMKGEGAADLKAGDTITVTGVIKNHLHSDGVRTTVEFDAGCTFTK